MSEDSFRIVLVVVIIGALVAFLAITADVMRQHPAIPWFGFGILATLVVEVFGYLIYLIIKQVRK